MSLPIYEKPTISKISQGALNKFGRKLHAPPLLAIEGKRVADLLEEFGSPLFVFSEARLVSRYRDLVSAFELRYPSVQPAWSYKTNFLAAVCRIFHREGAWAEVVSPFELERAMELGVPGREVIYNGPAKPIRTLERALAADVMTNIDNYDELAAIERILESAKAQPRSVGIRVNTEVSAAPHWDRFGFNLDNGEAAAVLERIRDEGRLKLDCVHCHLGTFIQQPEAYESAARKIARFCNEAADRLGSRPGIIDMGGGFASTNSLRGVYLPGDETAASFSSYAEAIASGLGDLDGDDRPTLVLETGRALVDEAGYLLSTVASTRRMTDGRRAVTLDAGLNVLPTATWYRHDIRPGATIEGKPEPTSIFGPLCMQIDVLRNNLLFPPVAPGAPVVISNAGAYNVTQWSQFTSPRPAVVMIGTDGDARLVRRREEFGDMTAQEVLDDAPEG